MIHISNEQGLLHPIDIGPIHKLLSSSEVQISTRLEEARA